MADPEQSSRRVELVETSTPSGSEAGRTGLGLIVGLVVGRSSLLGAATGTEQFEVAIAHFVGVVLASVAGVLLLGVLYDQATRSTPDVDDREATPADDDTTSLPSELPMSATS
jgi:hypothetical protein